MRRALLLALIPLLTLTIVWVTPAAGMKPDRVESVVFDPSLSVRDRFLSRQCGIDVMVTTAGHYKVTLFFDRTGEISRVVAHPSLRQTVSSSRGSFSTPDVGVDKTVFDDDAGTVTVFGTGIHLRVKGDASAIGLWRLVFDAQTGELVSEEYHGNFDLLAGDLLRYVCDQVT